MCPGIFFTLCSVTVKLIKSLDTVQVLLGKTLFFFYLEGSKGDSIHKELSFLILNKYDKQTDSASN